MNGETAKARGGHARAEALTPEQRREIAQKAARARHDILKATHGSEDHPLRIGDIELSCYVLEDGTRVLSQRGMISGLGMSKGGGSNQGGGDRLTYFLEGRGISPFVSNNLMATIRNPITFRSSNGPALGYPATILADICDAILAARAAGALQAQQRHIANQAETLVRGFARVGLIALVDEATGYQADRARDALAKILEAFIAQELQPWVPTFPVDFYRELFRLRGLPFPDGTVKRPQYFGVLTNDIVYRRLAPGVLEELRRVTPKDEDTGRYKARFFQRLTTNKGYPKLRELLGSVVTIMKLSKDWPQFKNTIDRLHPRYGGTMSLPFDYDEKEDDGKGI